MPFPHFPPWLFLILVFNSNERKWETEPFPAGCKIDITYCLASLRWIKNTCVLPFQQKIIISLFLLYLVQPNPKYLKANSVKNIFFWSVYKGQQIHTSMIFQGYCMNLLLNGCDFFWHHLGFQKFFSREASSLKYS